MSKQGHGDKLVSESVKPRATAPLIIGVAIAVVGASFQYGYNISVINLPAENIREFFFPTPERYEVCIYSDKSNVTEGSGKEKMENSTLCQEWKDFRNYQDNLYAIPVSVFAAAGMLGSILVGPVSKKFGRLKGLMLINVLSVIAALFLGLAKPASSFAMFVIGRIVIGVFAGLATGIVPMYIGELSPKQWRGAIGVLNQLLITIGILVAQVLGLSNITGNDTLWPLLMAFTCVPSLISFIFYVVMPESPRFLLIDKKEEAIAKTTLVSLRGTENVDAEIEEMRVEAAEQEAAGQLSVPDLFRDRSVRWQLICILLMMAAQQLSGINAVFFYSNLIFEKAGFEDSDSQDLASVALGVLNVVMTIISVAIIERVGRKALLVYGFGMMIFWCLAMTIFLNVLKNAEKGSAEWVSYLSIVCLCGYIIGFAIGPGPIPWLITAELFRQAARPAAFMVACLLNWTCNFIIGISFPAVANVTGPYVFIIFMFVCIAITVFLQIVLPETKGKTFQEISDLFAVRNKTKPSGNIEDPQKVPLRVDDSET